MADADEPGQDRGSQVRDRLTAEDEQAAQGPGGSATVFALSAGRTCVCSSLFPMSIPATISFPSIAVFLESAPLEWTSDGPESNLGDGLVGGAGHGRPEFFNTDQGAQFTPSAFTEVLKAHEVAISMDGKGAGSIMCSSSGCGAA